MAAGPPVVTLTSSEADDALDVGGTVTFTALAVGDAPFTYKWFLNGKEIPGQTNSTLTLNPVATPDSGIYQAEAKDTNTLASRSNLEYLQVTVGGKSVSVQFDGVAQTEEKAPATAKTFTAVGIRIASAHSSCSSRAAPESAVDQHRHLAGRGVPAQLRFVLALIQRHADLFERNVALFQIEPWTQRPTRVALVANDEFVHGATICA